MIRLGAFDRHLEPLAWWEVELLPAGWYVDELLVEPAAGGVTGTLTSTLSDATLSATGTVVTPSTSSAILISGSNNPSYRSGFYSPRRGGTPKYPSLWDGCVGAWAPSLGQTGSRLIDQSFYQNDGAITAWGPESAWVVSNGKGALYFDGAGSRRVEVVLPKTSLISICFWTIRDGGTDNAIVSNRPPSNDSGYAINFNTSYFRIAGAWWSITWTAPTSSMQNVCFTYDGSTILVYVNGAVQNSTSVSGSITYSGTENGFFAYSDVGGNGVFNGKLDDIRVYNRALAPPEIQLLATRRGIAYESKRRLAVRSGAASPSGTLAKTLDSVTLTSSGTLSGGAATGSLSSTLADATLSSSGTLASGLSGSVSVTLSDATLSSSGTVAAGASGTVTHTLDNVTLSSTGGAAGSVTGSVSSTLAAATCSATGTLTAGLSGTVVRTLDAVTSSASGTLTNGASGTVTRTLADATLASGGSLSAGLTAQVNRALESCVVSSSGTLASGLTGALSVQLAAATLQSGNVAVGGLRIKVGGEWKNANAFVKVTGTWKNATPFVKVSGVWK